MQRRVILVLASLVLSGCGPADDELITARLFVMATVVDLSLPAQSWADEPELIATIETELRTFERDYYAWADGELAALNGALTASARFEASEALAELLSQAQEISELTGGAFDPGVGALVELWGFHQSEGGNAGSQPGEPNDAASESARLPPPADAIADLLATSGSIRDLSFAGRLISARPARYTLDLGGIAKGAAIDRIVDLVEARGVATALINAGGDLRTVGKPADRSWRIGIQAPREDVMLGTIELDAGEAAFTSGDYERFFENAGDRLHHILDPRDGLPANHTQAITVLAREGATADAAATALFVAGPAEWRSMAAALGIDKVLRVDASGEIEMTSAMRDRFRQSSEDSSDIIAAAD